MPTFPIKDDFPDDFYDALGRVTLAFGRLEYVIKLTVKSLTGDGFSRGMAHAESRGAFHRLCSRAKELGNKKLPTKEAAIYTQLIDQALALAPERNDNSHACWTTDPAAVPLRLRPYWNTKHSPSTLEWRSRTVTPQELRTLARTMDDLFRAVDRERRTWPRTKT